MTKIQKKIEKQFHLIPFFIFHPKIVHQGATKLSSHRSHRTHRSFWRKVFSHRLHGYAQIRRVWHPCHTHAATKVSSHRTLRSLTICVHLCASVGGSSTPEASVYSVKSVGEYPPPETSVNSVNSVGVLAQTNLEWVLWKEFEGLRGYGRDAIPTQPPDYLPTEFTEHTETTGGEEKSVYICEIRGRTLCKQSFCAHL